MASLLVAALVLATPASAVAEETANTNQSATTVAAEQPLPWAKWSVGLKLGGMLAFPDGKATPKPMGVGFGLNMANPIGEKWGWSTEIGASSPMIVFNPAPYIFTGPAFTIVPKKFGLMPWALYQLNPSTYAAAKGRTTHYLGGGITPSVPIGDTLAMALPIGFGETVGGPKGIWQWNIGPKLIFRLPY
ncbi:MAG: hypothetical protein WCT40_04830 [Candidatus Magasanikbacteria bacterium]